MLNLNANHVRPYVAFLLNDSLCSFLTWCAAFFQKGLARVLITVWFVLCARSSDLVHLELNVGRDFTPAEPK